MPSRPPAARRSEERSKRLARRTLDALHPKAVEELEPEFGVVRNGKRQQFLISTGQVQGVRHGCQFSGDGNRRAQARDHQGEHL